MAEAQALDRYEVLAPPLREKLKILIKENTQVKTKDKIRENQPKIIKKQTLVYLVNIQ